MFRYSIIQWRKKSNSQGKVVYVLAKEWNSPVFCFCFVWRRVFLKNLHIHPFGPFFFLLKAIISLWKVIWKVLEEMFGVFGSRNLVDGEIQLMALNICFVLKSGPVNMCSGSRIKGVFIKIIKAWEKHFMVDLMRLIKESQSLNSIGRVL